MTETKKTTSLTRLVTVPIGWATYALDFDAIGELESSGAFNDVPPPASVLEALVMLGKAKRIATIHSVNMMAADDDDEGGEDSLFGEGSEA